MTHPWPLDRLARRPLPLVAAACWLGLACSHRVVGPDGDGATIHEATADDGPAPDRAGFARDGNASDASDASDVGDASDASDASDVGDASDASDGAVPDRNVGDVSDRDAPVVNPCAPGCLSCASGRCDDVAAVSVGRGHSCARMTDGSVRCWGYNENKLGDGTPWDRPVPVSVRDPATGMPFTHAEEVVASYYQTCVRTSAGVGVPVGVHCWGVDGLGQRGTAEDLSLPRIALPPTSQVAATFLHLCARAGDGTVRCWGRNDLGQLGDATTLDRSAPVPVLDRGAPLAGVAQIAIGGGYSRSFTCAVLAGDGAVRCWGANDAGQLGLGTADGAPHPTPAAVPGLTGVVELSAGEDFVCARMNDGTVRCWGNPANGRLGSNPSNPRLPTTVPALTGVRSVVTGDEHACALTEAGALQCWGLNASGQLGDGTTLTPREVGARVTVPLADVAAVSAGGHNTCALLRDRSLRCWGSNRGGEVADGATAVRAPRAVRVAGSDGALDGVQSLAAGNNLSCVTRARAVLCWGPAFSWQEVFEGNLRAAPVDLGAHRADALAIGARHACFLDRDDGSVRCWGSNDLKQLGVEDAAASRTNPASAPALLTGATRIAAGNGHTCARLLDGTVSCWGAATREQLGRGVEASETRAVALPVNVVSAVGDLDLSAGFEHTCVIAPGDRALCFGQNHFGSLGVGAPGAPSYTGVTRVALGAGHSCGLTTGGSVTCMGGNAEGALGSPGGDSSVPRPVPGLAGVTRISAGQAHTCVVRTGRVLCWGLNNFGQLGDGTVEDRATPQEVAMAGEATDVALGAFHSCALLRSGAVHCWGRSTDGQMGDGTSWHRATPARVVFR